MCVLQCVCVCAVFTVLPQYSDVCVCAVFTVLPQYSDVCVCCLQCCCSTVMMCVLCLQCCHSTVMCVCAVYSVAAVQ